MNRPLINLLKASALLLFAMPLVLGIMNGDFVEAVSGLSLLMAVIGLWLLLLGRMRVGRVLMEGKRAFAVGAALFLPFVVSVAVEQLGLWSWISWGAVFAGLVLAVLAYLTVASTRVGGDRRAASGLLLGGAILMVIGLGIPKPSDAEGLFLLNGAPVLAVSSMAAFIVFVGLAMIVVGIFGLVRGFGPVGRRT